MFMSGGLKKEGAREEKFIPPPLPTRLWRIVRVRSGLTERQMEAPLCQFLDFQIGRRR